MFNKGFPDSSIGKESACNAGDPGSVPGSGRSPGEGNGNPLQYSCLKNPMEGEALQATVHGVTKSQTRLSDFTFSIPLTIYMLQIPGEGKGYPFQYADQENSMGWIVHEVAKSRT